VISPPEGQAREPKGANKPLEASASPPRGESSTGSAMHSVKSRKDVVAGILGGAFDSEMVHDKIRGLRLKPEGDIKEESDEEGAETHNWLGGDSSTVVLQSGTADGEFEHRGGLKGLKLKPDPSFRRRGSSSDGEEDLVENVIASATLQSGTADDEFEHRGGLKGLKLKPDPSFRRRGSSSDGEEDLVENVIASATLQSGTADDEFEHRGGLKGLKLKPDAPTAGSGVSRHVEHAGVKSASTRSGGLPLSDNSEQLSTSGASRDLSEDSSSDDDDDDIQAEDWLKGGDATDLGKPIVSARSSESSGGEEEVTEAFEEEGDDEGTAESVAGDNTQGMFEVQGDLSGGAVVPRAASRQATGSTDATSEDPLLAQFQDFDDEWEHLKTLKLVFQRAGLALEQQKRFLLALVPEHFEEGAYIVKQGDVGDKFYIITEGEVAITKSLPDEEIRQLPPSKIRRTNSGQDQMQITHLYDGHFFGETSLAKEAPRNANVIVTSHEASVMSMTKEKFKPFMEEDEKFRSLIGQLIFRKEEAARKREEYLKKNGGMDEPQLQLEREAVKVSRVRVKKKTKDGKVILNNYVLQTKIGQGSYGTVWLALAVSDGKKYAIKMVNREKLKKKGKLGRGGGVDADEELLNEVAAMKKLSHPNVVKLYEVIDEPEKGKFYMVQEFMALGPIMDDVEYSTPLDLEVARAFFRQIVAGLAYMHFQGVIHRDIKPGNVLVGEGGVCKIADFGTVAILDDAVDEHGQPSDILTKIRGTAAFQPPEVFLLEPGQPYHGRPVDMWALGATLHTMVTGTPPFMGKNEFELVEKLKKGEFRVSIEVQLDPHLKNLLQGLLEVDASKRLTIEHVAEHDWVTQESTEPLIIHNYHKLNLRKHMDRPPLARRSVTAHPPQQLPAPPLARAASDPSTTPREDGGDGPTLGAEASFPFPEGAPAKISSVVSESIAEGFRRRQFHSEAQLNALAGVEDDATDVVDGRIPPGMHPMLASDSMVPKHLAMGDDAIAAGAAEAAVNPTKFMRTTPLQHSRERLSRPSEELAEEARALLASGSESSAKIPEKPAISAPASMHIITSKFSDLRGSVQHRGGASSPVSPRPGKPVPQFVNIVNAAQAAAADAKARETLASAAGKAYLRAMRNRQLRLMKEHQGLTDQDRDLLLDQQRFAISSDRADIEVFSVRVDDKGVFEDVVGADSTGGKEPPRTLGQPVRSMQSMRRASSGSRSRQARLSADMSSEEAVSLSTLAALTKPELSQAESGNGGGSSSVTESSRGTLSRFESEARIGRLQRTKDFVMVTSKVEGAEDGGAYQKKVIFRAKDPSLSIFSARAGMSKKLVKKHGSGLISTPSQNSDSNGSFASSIRPVDPFDPVSGTAVLETLVEVGQSMSEEGGSRQNMVGGSASGYRMVVESNSARFRSPSTVSSDSDDSDVSDVDVSEGLSDEDDDGSDYGDVQTVDAMETTKVGTGLQSMFDELIAQPAVEDETLGDLQQAESKRLMERLSVGLTAPAPAGTVDTDPVLPESARGRGLSPEKRNNLLRGAASSASLLEGALAEPPEGGLPPSHNETLELRMAAEAGRKHAFRSAAGGSAERLGIVFAVCDSVGRRSGMEDRFLAVPDLWGQLSSDVALGNCKSDAEASAISRALEMHGGSPMAMFGVFDGHNGESTAEYLVQRFPVALGASAPFPSQLRSALTSAASTVDNEYMDLAERFHLSDGATGTLVLFELVSSGELTASASSPAASRQAASEGGKFIRVTCANVGDSRAVLCRRGVAVELSKDHKCTRPDERRRIEAAGGWIAKDRLCGVLAVTRAYGDIEHKRLKGECWGKTFSGDTLISEPEFRTESLDPPVLGMPPRDEFIIVACDGVWDVMTSQQAVNFVRRSIAAHGDASLAARDLVQKAIDLNTIDNCTAAIIFLSHQPIAGTAAAKAFA
jgi:serine/threonine protein kinase/serine/threonine protein phosphatase PrpC/CRP-like cAMP-binding protein